MTPTFVNHCHKMYETLHSLATDKEISTGTARVFTGSYTDAWKSTKIAQSYYSPVRKSLQRNNAIEILQRGGRNTDTVIVLLGLPDTWIVDGWNDSKDLTRMTESARVRQRLDDLEKSLGGMNILQALQEFEQRLIAAEKKINTLYYQKEIN